jgi:Tfp pilus assembly protein PilO
MKAQFKLAIALTPFVAAAAVASTYTYPAFLDAQSKLQEVKQKEADKARLDVKLKDKSLVEAEKQNLETQIQLLRGAVPKSPEMDLLVLDMEKLCNESGVDLIAVEEPAPETLQAIKTSESSMQELSSQNDGKITMGSKSLPKPSIVQAKTDGKTDTGQPKPDDTALKKVLKEVYVTGDYDGILAYMKRLESYQRVLGVSNVSLAMATKGSEVQRTPAAEKAKKLELNQPVLSYLMTVYYLP